MPDKMKGSRVIFCVQAMPLIRAINSLCVLGGARQDHLLRFPRDYMYVILAIYVYIYIYIYI